VVAAWLMASAAAAVQEQTAVVGDGEVRGGFAYPQGRDPEGQRWLSGSEAERDDEWRRDHARAGHGDAHQPAGRSPADRGRAVTRVQRDRSSEVERQRRHEALQLTFAERLRRNDATVAFFLRLRAAARRPLAAQSSPASATG